MNEILTEIEIAARPEDVWEVLTDFDAYPQWNSMMWPARGELKPGACLCVRVRMSAWFRFTFRPIVHRADPGRELSWRGRLPARLLQGEHSFAIQPFGPDRVRFVHQERFTGLLVPVYMWLMAPWATRAYNRMNRELKARAEHIHAPSQRAVPLGIPSSGAIS